MIATCYRVTRMRGPTGALILEPAPSPYASSLKLVYIFFSGRFICRCNCASYSSILLVTCKNLSVFRQLRARTLHNPRLVRFNPRVFRGRLPVLVLVETRLEAFRSFNIPYHTIYLFYYLRKSTKTTECHCGLRRLETAYFTAG